MTKQKPRVSKGRSSAAPVVPLELSSIRPLGILQQGYDVDDLCQLVHLCEELADLKVCSRFNFTNQDVTDVIALFVTRKMQEAAKRNNAKRVAKNNDDVVVDVVEAEEPTIEELPTPPIAEEPVPSKSKRTRRSKQQIEEDRLRGK